MDHVLPEQVSQDSQLLASQPEHENLDNEPAEELGESLFMQEYRIIKRVGAPSQ